jgi:hypothetical protein
MNRLLRIAFAVSLILAHDLLTMVSWGSLFLFLVELGTSSVLGPF